MELLTKAALLLFLKTDQPKSIEELSVEISGNYAFGPTSTIRQFINQLVREGVVARRHRTDANGQSVVDAHNKPVQEFWLTEK